MSAPSRKAAETVTLSRKQVDDIIRRTMGWESIDVRSFWKLARQASARQKGGAS